MCYLCGVCSDQQRKQEPSAERWALTQVTRLTWNPAKHRFEEAEHFPDATARDEGNSNAPTRWGLRVARAADPETGTILDVDGSRSVEYHAMEAVQVYHMSDGAFTVTGFVAERDDEGRYTGNYRREQWYQSYYEEGEDD